MAKQTHNKWNGKSRGGAFGHAFFVLLIKGLGVKFAYAFLFFIVPYFVIFAPKASRVIIRYNRRIHQYGVIKSIIKLFQHYYTFGQTLIDKAAIISGLEDKYNFSFENYDEFLKVLDSGAVVMIGAHVGSWEIGSSFFGDYASRLNVVMYDGEYQKIKKVVDTSSFGYKIIPINKGGIESLIKMKSAVDRGEYLCFQGDRYTDEGSRVSVNFMGHNANFPTGPTLLASKFKIPVVFYFSMREKGMKYRFMFKIIEAGKSKEDIMNQYIKELESIIVKYPQQWFNFFDLWQS